MSLMLATLLFAFFIFTFTFQQNFAQFVLDDTPDERCITPNGQPGLCTVLNNCQHLFQAFIRREVNLPAQKQYLQNALCRQYQAGRMPNVCCDIDTGPCITPEDQLGSCVPLDRCGHLNNFLENNPSRSDYKQASRCLYNGMQKAERFCCPIFVSSISGSIITQNGQNGRPQESSTQSVPNPLQVVIGNQVVSTESRARLPTPGEGEGFCGTTEIADKIINGDVSDIYDFPWMALLQMGNGEFACGASLITDRYVLTAAHCVKGEAVRLKNNVTMVRLGEWDLGSNNDCIARAGGWQDCAPKPVDVPPEEIIVHEGYVERTLENDIALIRLREKVRISEFIKPVCLPTVPLNLQSTENFTVAGWGATEMGQQSDKKLFLGNLFLSDRSLCSAPDSPLNEGQLCVGSRISQGTCKGDSGGPLMVVRKLPGVAAIYYQIGIVSYGTTVQCGQRPNVYTKVENYITWIANNIRT